MDQVIHPDPDGPSEPRKHEGEEEPLPIPPSDHPDKHLPGPPVEPEDPNHM